MVSIDDIQWLGSIQARQFWDSISTQPANQASAVLNRARQLFTPARASLIAMQFELLSVAKKKVLEPTRWFWTRQLLEQASDELTANETAADFPSDSHVHDICCGAGSDAIALASRNWNVTAYDRCAIACELTRLNAESKGKQIKVVETSAEDILVPTNDFINIDPDRRAEGRRVTNLDRLAPSAETILSLVARARGLSLKLSPGLRIDRTASSEVILAPESIRYLSKDGAVKQQRWYWGIDRWPKDSIAVSTHSKSSNYAWAHEVFDRDPISNERNPSLIDRCLDYVADYDPAIRAAEKGAEFASRYQWNIIDSNSGYLTASQPTPHPMVRWFRLLQDIPMDRKQMKAMAKSLLPKAWELKSRGVDIDLDQMRKYLPTGSQSGGTLTILLTLVGGRHRALFCSEVAS